MLMPATMGGQPYAPRCRATQSSLQIGASCCSAEVWSVEASDIQDAPSEHTKHHDIQDLMLECRADFQSQQACRARPVLLISRRSDDAGPARGFAFLKAGR